MLSYSLLALTVSQCKGPLATWVFSGYAKIQFFLCASVTTSYIKDKDKVIII